MNPDWLDIGLGDPAWIVIAFLGGFAARSVKLPPLVGFLAAGFALHAIGAQPGAMLDGLADFGITLLLFTIGLKLTPKALARPEILGVGIVALVLATAGFSSVVWLLARAQVGFLSSMSSQSALLIGFALSFSSTVFAVKVLEDRGATATHHGQVAIGVLVVQDVAAVLFLAASAGVWPSVWALLLVLLLPLRYLLRRVLRRSGHGEMLVLFGVTAAVAGAALFELVGIEGDVGALVLGMLLAGGTKADELNKALLGLKDLFLVGFFLSIGMTALPTAIGAVLALLVVVLLPVRTLMFFYLFSWRHLRARTSWQASLDLTSYSEFGLIVALTAVQAGWLPSDWLPTIALAIAGSFALSSPLAERGDRLYTRWNSRFERFERRERLPSDEDLHEREIDVIVFGLGRMGSRAFEAVHDAYEGRVLGVDIDPNIIAAQAALGRDVVQGDATDPEFWSRASGLIGRLHWVLLTMSSHEANVAAVQRLRERSFAGQIAATSTYRDDARQLRGMGVDFAFDVYAEAGAGFAGDLRSRFKR